MAVYNYLILGFQSFLRSHERPFNSEHKYMAVSGIHADDPDKRERCYIKGAVEVLLDRCKFYYVSEESTLSLDSTTKTLISSRAAAAASRGLRVIALCYGFGSVDDLMPAAPSSEGRHTAQSLQPNLVFVGFQAMLDPPRSGVADAISLLHSGGVQIVMITGDAEHTALSIARQLGLRVQPGTVSCLTGAALDNMTKAQLRERVASVSVFARTSPRHKMAIVEAFQSRGAVVAMTGDGGESFYPLYPTFFWTIFQSK